MTGPGSTRRAFLQAGGALGLLAFVPPGRLAEALAAPPGRFLTAHELDTLRAVTARFVPGPPDDPDPGALEAGVAEAIDLFLGAFAVSPPLIHAGGPFSDRHGAPHDDFADFVGLDAHAELGWRIRLEGSRGMPEREFAGPVRGLQQIYREGLAHLDERAGGSFAALPGPAQDAILSDLSDDAVQELVGVALSDTLDAMYGPPEYGGNRGLTGWSYTRWDGDVQPRGHTDAEVTRSGPAGGPLPDVRRFHAALGGARAARSATARAWRGLPGR